MGTGLLFIYFLYGLAFWAMGLAVLLESGRVDPPSQARSLRWLSAFGIIHGSHEWLEAFLLLAASLGNVPPGWLQGLRLGLLASSFACLSAYSLTALEHAPPRLSRRMRLYALAILTTFAALLALGSVFQQAPVQWVAVLDAAVRYVLAVPSAVLASLALWSASRTGPKGARSAIGRDLQLAAAGFAGYALGQLFVHRLPWFPANLLNQEWLVSTTGVPIQAIRAAMAALIAVGLLRAMQGAEVERQQQLDAAHRAGLEALQQQDSLRRDLLRHVVRTQEDERSRIARELHDQVAQLLSALTLRLGALRSRLKKPETLEMVDQLQGLAREMSESMYQLVGDLRPSHLDSLGLVPALRFLLSQEYRPKGLDITLTVTGQAKPLKGLIDTALFRVAQEALMNISRHAQVSSAVIELHYSPASITMRICDEGRGFDPLLQLNPPRGWGLAGMRERVEALGGHLALRSAPSMGTTVEAVVPLALPPDQEASNA